MEKTEFKENVVTLSDSIVSVFKAKKDWKDAPRKSRDYVLVKVKDLDLYMFIGIYNSTTLPLPDIIRIGLASKDPAVIKYIAKQKEELEMQTQHQFDHFEQRGIQPKRSGGVSSEVEKYKFGIMEWQEDFIAISYKKYPEVSTKDMLKSIDDIDTAEKAILGIYDRDWAILTNAIIEKLRTRK